MTKVINRKTLAKRGGGSGTTQGGGGRAPGVAFAASRTISAKTSKAKTGTGTHRKQSSAGHGGTRGYVPYTGDRT